MLRSIGSVFFIHLFFTFFNLGNYAKIWNNKGNALNNLGRH